MQGARAVGRNAAALKYDILTALGSHGCAGDKYRQRLVLRFITLIVARYNWQSDEIATGQQEMAQMWAVDARTVKRDIAALRELGWLVQKRPAARGRVAVHGLGTAAILQSTQKDWARVGSDFVSRMEPQPAAQPSTTNVIVFPAAPEGNGLWDRVQGILRRENPELYQAWFAILTEVCLSDGVLTLHAPSRFHASFLTTHHRNRIEVLVQSVDPDAHSVVITA